MVGGVREGAEREPPVEMIEVLAEDPELGERLERGAREEARRMAIAPVRFTERGNCSSSFEEEPAGGHLGLLVLDGLIVRHVMLGEVVSSELLGPGDLLRPWARIRDHLDAVTVRWEMLTPGRVAELDQDFAHRIRPWPEIISALLDRARARADAQLWLAGFRQARRVEDRLHAVLWYFGHRWGQVTAEETVPPAPYVRGELLARVVGCRRQSVSTALGRLADQGVIARRADGKLVVRGTLPRLLTAGSSRS
jgi:CRP/FNR family transcriptional regulator, cyclic AMP receptor protein